ERLQHVKDEPLAAVEEPEPDHVTIDEVEARPDEQRQPPPARLEPVDALVRTPEEASPTAPFATLAQLLNRLQSGIAVVLVNPGADGRLIPVVLDEVPAQPRGGPPHVKVMIDQFAGIERHGRPAEQLQQVLRVVPPVADPASSEDLPAIDEESVVP